MVTERTSFGRKLRRSLDRQGVSVRELARRIRPDDPETGRRNIARWLAPVDRAVTPSRATINAVADVLGVDPAELADDDEESDPAVTLVNLVKQIAANAAREAVRA